MDRREQHLSLFIFHLTNTAIILLFQALPR